MNANRTSDGLHLICSGINVKSARNKTAGPYGGRGGGGGGNVICMEMVLITVDSVVFKCI